MISSEQTIPYFIASARKTEVSVLRGVTTCLLEFATIALIISLNLILSLSEWGHAALYATSIVVIGSRMRALGNIVHECAHHTFTTHRRFNTLCGHVLCAFDFRSFRQYKREHMAHHRFLGDKYRDPDYLGPDFSLGRYLKNFLPVVFLRRDSFLANALRISWLVGLVALMVFPTSRIPTLVYYFVPLLTSYFALRIYSDFADHWGLTHHHDSTLRSRNHAFHSWLLNTIFLPRNDGFHLLHHLFPNLPTWCYKAVHHQLMTTDQNYRRLHHEV